MSLGGPAAGRLVGLFTGGVATDGMVGEGLVTPGTVTDGVVTPGTVTPGTVTDGVVTPGTVTDGVVTPGTVTDGAVTEGAVTPGTVTLEAVTCWTPIEDKLIEDTVRRPVADAGATKNAAEIAAPKAPASSERHIIPRQTISPASVPHPLAVSAS